VPICEYNQLPAQIHMSFSTGSRKSARIHNRFFNIRKMLSNHLAEQTDDFAARAKTFSFHEKKLSSAVALAS
jgi:hypothetical protein